MATENTPLTIREYEQKALRYSSDALDVLHAQIMLQSLDTPLARLLEKQAKNSRAIVGAHAKIYSARTNRESVAMAMLKHGLIDKADVKRLIE